MRPCVVINDDKPWKFYGGIIYYNKKDKIIKFSGAETPLFYIDENQELKL